MGGHKRLSRVGQVVIVVFGYAWIAVGLAILQVLAQAGTPPDLFRLYVSWPVIVWFAVPTALIVWWHWERVPPSGGARVVFALGLCLMMAATACATTRALYAALPAYERGARAAAVLLFASKFVEVVMAAAIAFAVALGAYALLFRRRAE